MFRYHITGRFCFTKLLKNEDYIDQILKEGAEKANEQSSEKVKEMKKIIGF